MLMIFFSVSWTHALLLHLCLILQCRSWVLSIIWLYFKLNWGWSQVTSNTTCLFDIQSIKGSKYGLVPSLKCEMSRCNCAVSEYFVHIIIRLFLEFYCTMKVRMFEVTCPWHYIISNLLIIFKFVILCALYLLVIQPLSWCTLIWNLFNTWRT